MSNPAISPRGPWWSGTGLAVNSVTVKPFNVGDLLVLTFVANGGPVTAVSSSNVTGWACASSYYDTVALAYTGIWYGVVTALGSSTVTVTDAGDSSYYETIWVWEFTATGANWQLGEYSPAPFTAGGFPSTTGTPVIYPSLSPSGGGNDLYIGAASSYYGGLSEGSTSGFLYTNPASNGPVQVCWNTSVNTAVSPQSGNLGSTYVTVAAMFTAGAGVVTAPAYAAGYGIISGGTGSWSNPGNATGVPSGSFATWNAP